MTSWAWTSVADRRSRDVRAGQALLSEADQLPSLSCGTRVFLGEPSAGLVLLCGRNLRTDEERPQSV
jgi:hypothetical protein